MRELDKNKVLVYSSESENVEDVDIVKIKVYGDSFPRVLSVIDEVRDNYAPNVTQSNLKQSQPRGWHGFLTIYFKEESL